MDGAGEAFYTGEGLFDGLADFLGRRKLRGAKPVMADPALLVRVGDGAFLQSVHCLKGTRCRPLHPGEKVLGKSDSAQVQGHPSRGDG